MATDSNYTPPRAPIGPRRHGCAGTIFIFIGFAILGAAVFVALLSFGPLVAVAGIIAIGIAINRARRP